MDGMGHDLRILSQICDPQTVFTATVLRNWFIVGCLRRTGVDTKMWALLRSQGANSVSCYMPDLILISHAMSRL